MQPEILECGHTASKHSPSSTGYGSMADGSRHCWDCCAKVDREYMLKHGKITLYLSKEAKGHKVSNWPGSLSFAVTGGPRRSYHNMAHYRYDVWFFGPDDHLWHGVQYGDNTQLCHCKRTRQTKQSIYSKRY